MNRVKRVIKKGVNVLQEEGVKGFAKRAKNSAIFRAKVKLGIINTNTQIKDVLFINGCALPHPQRYRVDHQVEQLLACGVTTDKIPANLVEPKMIKYYRAVVIFRCPITPEIQQLIETAHYFNKTVFYDIDDLVIDTKYTDKIEALNTLTSEERKMYDADVKKMGETMKMSDYCITTTSALARELEKYGKEVFVNKNVASEEMVKLSQEAMKNARKDTGKIRIGYLSGSSTHNLDFEMIRPAIQKIMNEFPDVELVIVGELDLPKEMREFSDRIEQKPFVDWRELPAMIASLDINLAPIERSVFNEAKSENKWTEAAFCRVPTVASNFGAFAEVIKDGETGVLCSDVDEWYQKIVELVEDSEYRQRIAEKAYRKVMKEYITTYTGVGLSRFIKSKLAKNIGIVMPSTDVVSGGVNVALRHCDILRRNGYDVTAIDMHKNDENVKVGEKEVNVINGVKHESCAEFDELVATMYTTMDYVLEYPLVRERRYLVQGFETDFYDYTEGLRARANATYNRGGIVKYLTISRWCQKWLKDIFGQEAKYAPNGICVENYPFRKRKFEGKIKILVEGNPENEYKNVDESFRIANKLDKDRFEVVFLSYGSGPKDWYEVDKVYTKIPFEEVGKIYNECDILLKTSTLESFSYPPLEMMATGGYVVARPNEGNLEYLRDGKNCLLYEPGDVEDALRKIEKIVSDKLLRKELDEGMKKVVVEHDWNKIENKVLSLYNE